MCGGWRFSYFFYILAIIALIIAIIYAIWNATRTGNFDAQAQRNSQNATYFFWGAIALGILAIATQKYETIGALSNGLTSVVNKTY